MKSVIYARSATNDQTPDGNTTQTQIEICKKYAKERGHEVIEVYIDDGYSGITLDRPGLNAMRHLLLRVAICAVIITDFARLARDAAVLSCLRQEFAKRKVELHCVRISTDKPSQD